MRLAIIACNVPAAFGNYRRRADIEYGTDPRHRLDLYIPGGAAPASRPLLVFWHGGRWSWGDKADYRFVAAAMAELGYVTVVPNYRLHPQVNMAGFMADAARAACWAAAHAGEFGADSTRMYFMGHSAGAHIAALLTLDHGHFAAAGLTAPPIAGVIGLSGAYDFLPLKEADLQEMFGPPERYPHSQPVNYVHAGTPPMLLVHGSTDTTVLPRNSRNLACALHACGAPVILKLYPGVGHAGTVAALSLPARRRAATLADIAAFVNPPNAQAAFDAADGGVA